MSELYNIDGQDYRYYSCTHRVYRKGDPFPLEQFQEMLKKQRFAAIYA